MSNKQSESPAHPYEPEPYPLLRAVPEFGQLSEPEKAALMEALARRLGGQGYRPRDAGEDRGR